ncbi:MAG: alpha/beta fold hydrolase [Bryobacteraceae bacterium]
MPDAFLHTTRSILLLSMIVGALAAGQTPDTKVPRSGFDLYYRVSGAGRPVVILTGGPGFDCDYMTPVASEIAKSNQAILVELRGTGRSLPSVIGPETINVKGYLEDLEALRANLNLERWTVLGHSAGGVLAMHYAAAHPERVDRLVLVGTAPIAAEFMDAYRDNLEMRVGPEPLQSNDPASFKKVLPALFFDLRKGEAFAAAFPAAQLHADVSRMLGAEMMRPGADLRPQLKNFVRPTLLVNGRQDAIDARMAYETHLALKGSELQFINRCGHFPWIEQPRQFFEIVERFLASGTN